MMKQIRNIVFVFTFILIGCPPATDDGSKDVVVDDGGTTEAQPACNESCSNCSLRVISCNWFTVNGCWVSTGSCYVDSQTCQVNCNGYCGRQIQGQCL